LSSIPEIAQLAIPWLLVIVFIIHDGEEVLALPKWVKQNQPLFEDLEVRFPMLQKTIQFARENDQQQFTLSVTFLLVMMITVTTMITFEPGNNRFQSIFIGITEIYTLHYFIHFFQSIFICKIVPGTISAILVFPISLFLWQYQIRVMGMNPGQSTLAFFDGLAVFLAVFILANGIGHLVKRSNRKPTEY
jgi:hypothetical protein